MVGDMNSKPQSIVQYTCVWNTLIVFVWLASVS